MAVSSNSRWIMETREESVASVAPCKIRSEKNERSHRRQDTAAGSVTSLLQKWPWNLLACFSQMVQQHLLIKLPKQNPKGKVVRGGLHSGTHLRRGSANKTKVCDFISRNEHICLSLGFPGKNPALRGGIAGECYLEKCPREWRKQEAEGTGWLSVWEEPPMFPWGEDSYVGLSAGSSLPHMGQGWSLGVFYPLGQFCPLSTSIVVYCCCFQGNFIHLDFVFCHLCTPQCLQHYLAFISNMNSHLSEWICLAVESMSSPDAGILTETPHAQSNEEGVSGVACKLAQFMGQQHWYQLGAC